MISTRYIAAGCALALFATSAFAGNGPFESALAGKPGASTMVFYVENFEGVPFGEIPADGLDLPAVTVRYAGGATSGVQNTRPPGECPQNVASGYALGSVERAAPYDIVIDFKVAPTYVQLGACGSPSIPTEDTTIDFFAADGAKLKSITFAAGSMFAERVEYSGSTPVGHVAIHGGGFVYIDNFIIEVPDKK
jgi:hypothetical protein